MKTKYIYKNGNWTDLYREGDEVIFKWHTRWLILTVKYDKIKNKTMIKLIR